MFTNHEILVHMLYIMQQRTVGSRLVLDESLSLQMVATVSRAALNRSSVPVCTPWHREQMYLDLNMHTKKRALQGTPGSDGGSCPPDTCSRDLVPGVPGSSPEFLFRAVLVYSLERSL